MYGSMMLDIQPMIHGTCTLTLSSFAFIYQID